MNVIMKNYFIIILLFNISTISSYSFIFIYK